MVDIKEKSAYLFNFFLLHIPHHDQATIIAVKKRNYFSEKISWSPQLNLFVFLIFICFMLTDKYKRYSYENMYFVFEMFLRMFWVQVLIWREGKNADSWKRKVKPMQISIQDQGTTKEGTNIVQKSTFKKYFIWKRKF